MLQKVPVFCCVWCVCVQCCELTRYMYIVHSLLTEHPELVHRPDSDGRCPLAHAAAVGRVVIVDKLLEVPLFLTAQPATHLFTLSTKHTAILTHPSLSLCHYSTMLMYNVVMPTVVLPCTLLRTRDTVQWASCCFTLERT